MSRWIAIWVNVQQLIWIENIAILLQDQQTLLSRLSIVMR